MCTHGSWVYGQRDGNLATVWVDAESIDDAVAVVLRYLGHNMRKHNDNTVMTRFGLSATLMAL